VLIPLALLLIGGIVYLVNRRRSSRIDRVTRSFDGPPRSDGGARSAGGGRSETDGGPGVGSFGQVVLPEPAASAEHGGLPPLPEGDTTIVVSDLTKRYGDVVAVSELSFDVRPGRVTGFLGPNGAGKTTTLRMVLGLTTPTAGTATIGGVRYGGLDRPIRRVGAVLEGSAAHRGRTGRDHLRIICRAGGVPPARADEVLALVGLTAAARRLFRGYSLGMRQRLGIAAALIGNPQVLILDEPANGLDPEGIRWLRDLLRGLADQGRTVLVSSHLLAEVQALADDVVIIARGRLVAHGSVDSVLDSVARPERILVQTPEPDRLIAQLGAGAVVTRGTGGELYISGVDAAAISVAAQRAGVTLHQLTPERRDLEDAFLHLTAGAAS
jgi:ABC-2 type transport system ATP-binding protein